MSWGIADTAPDIEKIKAESADYLNGLNSCGVIDYSTYSNAFDFYADLLDKAYEQGQKDAERKPGRWILHKDKNGYTYGECSECGMRQWVGLMKYCSDCGAKMKMEVEHEKT